MIRNIGIAGVLLMLAGSSARGQDKFYAIIFGQEDGKNRFCEDHAICDIGLRPGESILRTGTAHGYHGSYLVTMHLRNWMIEPGVSHDWVARSLKLDQYAIAKGGWEYQGPGRMEPPSIAVAGGAAQRKADPTAKPKTEKKADPAAVASGAR